MRLVEPQRIDPRVEAKKSRPCRLPREAESAGTAEDDEQAGR